LWDTYCRVVVQIREHLPSGNRINAGKELERPNQVGSANVQRRGSKDIARADTTASTELHLEFARGVVFDTRLDTERVLEEALGHEMFRSLVVTLVLVDSPEIGEEYRAFREELAVDDLVVNHLMRKGEGIDGTETIDLFSECLGVRKVWQVRPSGRPLATNDLVDLLTSLLLSLRERDKAKNNVLERSRRRVRALENDTTEVS
jgi:hypothetical protein